jgi:hypothetical protein
MESEFEFEGVRVQYKFREAKQDRQHLVVVFAGVQLGEHDFYGFDGHALDHVKGSILWIKDSFDGHNSYYIGSNLSTDVERAVSALIDATLEELELANEDCTLLGGSKGGSAALHLGLKHGYRNIIASAPQSLIGSYVRHKLPDTFAYMAGPDADASEHALNQYLSGLIASPSSFDKNIYLITSEADPEFKIHIEPLLRGLREFENFNLLLTDSTLVTTHPDVTAYNVPFILSTLYALCEGVVPRFGDCVNGNGERDRALAHAYYRRKSFDDNVVAGLHWAQIKGDRMVFRGYAAEIGVEAAAPPEIPPVVVAHGGAEDIVLEVEPRADRTLNQLLYRAYFRNYLWAGMGTPGDRGVSLEPLPVGSFQLMAEIHSGRRVPLGTRKAQSVTGIASGSVYVLDAQPTATRVTKLALDTDVAADSFFRIDELSADGYLLKIRGVFAVPREEMRVWNEGMFALTLRNRERTISLPLSASNVGAVQDLPTSLCLSSHQWSGFSTPGHRGLDLGFVPEGDYSFFVSFVSRGRVYRGHEPLVLSATPSRVLLQEVRR